MKPEHVTSVVRVSEERFKKPYVFKVSLPSNGYLYDGRFPAGELYISPMVAADEQLLSSQRSDKVQIIDLLCKRCIVECPVPYEDLLVADTFYLLLCIRSISYGNDYDFQLTCPACSTKFRKIIRIPDDLSVTCLVEEDDCEPYEVTLPMSGDRVTFRLLRNKDEESIRRYAKNKYQKSVEEGDPSYCYRLATHIVEINGEKKDVLQRLMYVENLLAADASELKEQIAARDFGANLLLNYDCPSCGRSSEDIIPFDANFFRRQSRPRN